MEEARMVIVNYSSLIEMGLNSIPVGFSGHASHCYRQLLKKTTTKTTKLRGFSPHANYNSYI
jgi:hypothetical protein